ncbi:MAG: sugar ABC transporter permease [Elusimicrobiota bacterium]|jgi:putative spermidine/putrescine transport system permease protein|nr:sugar ABC transporter permease [Elusimicrobiota bacterium]
MKNFLAYNKSMFLLIPATAFLLIVFVYPFLYGFFLSFSPDPIINEQGVEEAAGWLYNYKYFFSRTDMWPTVLVTLKLSLPVTIFNVLLSLPIAFALRIKTRYQKAVTTILVIPITLGTVLIAEGMLMYFGPKGWFIQALSLFGLGDLLLVHNATGVIISLVISGFPFIFLLVLSYITGIDPGLPRAAATLGASPWQQFRHVYLPLLTPGIAMAFCLAFVQAYSVFPSAILLGNPSGSTRVISIAAYEAAFEQYNYPLGSTVAMIMGFVQLIVVAAVLKLRGLFYRGPITGGKG